MSIIDRFMKTNKRRQYLDQRIIWGIWAPRWLQLTCKQLAADLRVPMSVLICHILRQWLAKNYETITENQEYRVKLADYLARENFASQEKD